MKHLFKGLLIAGIALAVTALAPTPAQAQIKPFTLQGKTAQLVSKSLDTLSNTDTSYLYFESTGMGYNLHFTTSYTRITGTAGGSIVWFGSDDGSNWYAINNVVTGTVSSQYADTATFSSLSSGSATKDFFYCGNAAYKWKWYRGRLITSGTQTGSWTGTAYYRKPD